MRKKPQKKRLMIAAVCLLAVLAGIFLPALFRLNRIQNVFDEVYYAFKQPFWPRYTYCDVWGMNVWHQEPNPQETMRYYDEEYMDSSHYMSVSFSDHRYSDENRVLFCLGISLNEGEIPANLMIMVVYRPDFLQLEYRNVVLSIPVEYRKNVDMLRDEYNLSDIVDPAVIGPILEQNNVTREDIANYQHYILYERFLPDWFAANSGPSKFSMDDLGEFTVVDETYRLLGEDWGK